MMIDDRATIHRLINIVTFEDIDVTALRRSIPVCRAIMFFSRRYDKGLAVRPTALGGRFVVFLRKNYGSKTLYF